MIWIILLLNLVQPTFLVLNDNEILYTFKYSIGNFGHVPQTHIIRYGKTYTARVYTDRLYPQLCEPSSLQHLTGKLNQNQPFFLLIQRGDCKFVLKAFHAQQLGAKMAIIQNNDIVHNNTITMIGDGYGYQLNIPVVMINHEDGQKLKKINKDSKTAVQIKFITLKKQKSFIKFWLDTSQRMTYNLIRDYRFYNQKLKDKTDFQPYFKIKSNCLTNCQRNCYGNFPKYYCLQGRQATGKQLIRQSLIEYFIFQQYKSKFLDQFDLKCQSFKGRYECALDLISNLGMNSKKIESLMEYEIQDMKNSKSVLGNSWIQQQRNHFIYRYPSVFVNEQLFRGDIDATNLYEFVCSTLLDPGQQCNQFNQNHNWLIQFLKISFIGIISILLIGFIVIFLYRLYIKRVNRSQFSNNVTSMVSEYIAINQKKSRQNYASQ